jgi:hypothetical protein
MSDKYEVWPVACLYPLEQCYHSEALQKITWLNICNWFGNKYVRNLYREEKVIHFVRDGRNESISLLVKFLKTVCYCENG